MDGVGRRYPPALWLCHGLLQKRTVFDIEFQKYLQFTFYKQWNKLKAYVNSLGIRMIGDIPIYVAMDSADAWANPSLFQLDEKMCLMQ